MDHLVNYAFNDLVTRFDELTVTEPRSFKALLDLFSELQMLSQDFEELLRLIEKVGNTNED